MLFTPWLATFRNRTSQRRRVNHRDTAANPLSNIELLEARTLLTGPELVAIRPNVGTLYDTMRDPITEGIEVRSEAPREVIFEFSPGESINAASAQTGIRITRAGHDGTFGDINDVIITPGFIGVLDPTNQANEVTVRFAENLPDDLYRFEVIGSSATPLTNNAMPTPEPFSSGTDFALDVEFDLGVQIVSVVQEPVGDDRTSLQIVDIGDLADGDTISIATANSYARAISDFGTGNVEVLFEALERGVNGNSIEINTTAVDLGNGAGPDVVVTDRQIEVTLNTNAASTSTAQDLIDAIGSNPDASALVEASILSGNSAEDITGTATMVVLAGGAAPVVFELEAAAAGDGVTALAVQIDFDPTGDSTGDVADAIATAINESVDLPLHLASVNGDTVFIDAVGGAPAITVTAATPAAVNQTDGIRYQRKNTIRLYFNDDDLALEATATSDPATDPSVVDPHVYQLHLTRDTARNTDDVVYNPVSVIYDPASDIAELIFEQDVDQLVDPLTGMAVGAATFRLRVGNDEAIPSVPNQITPGDAASDFANAMDLTDSFIEFDTGGVLSIRDGSHFADEQQFVLTDDTGASQVFEFEDAGGGGITGDVPIGFDSATPTSANGMAIAIRDAINGSALTVTAQLDPDDDTQIQLLRDRSVELDDDLTGISFGTKGLVISGSIVNQTPYVLQLPGSDIDPGHRFIFEQSNLGGQSDGTPGITTIQYNFAETLGGFPNVITEKQKDTARKILELYSYFAGLQFQETDASGFTIATIDLAAIGRTSEPGGVLGVGSVGNFTSGFLAMDNAENWDDTFGTTEAGIPWFVTALHEIGHVLGLGHADEAPPGTIMGGVLGLNTLGGESDLLFGNTPVEPAVPGLQDIIHLRHIFRPESKDIDTYRFEVQEGDSGLFTAETVAERQASASDLDTALTLWRENADGSREIISSNDDYYSKDSFIELALTEGTYYLTVTASGNDQIDPTIEDSGFGGTTQGNYDLRLNFAPDRGRTLVDQDNTGNTNAPAEAQSTLLDGDLDGSPGGEFNYWFRTAPQAGNESPGAPKTVFVDKTAAGGGDGSLSTPYNSIPDALAASSEGDIVRILANAGADNDLDTTGDNVPYAIGIDTLGQTLSDGPTLDVPKGVTVVVDAGTIFKMFDSQVRVGSSSAIADNSGSALQVLGTPENSVFITSYRDASLGVDIDPFIQPAVAGDYAGIQFRNDIDSADGRFNYESEAIFLNHVNHADIRYGGGTANGQVSAPIVNPVDIIQSRPTVSFNTITLSADHAIAADPDSFRDDTFQTPQFQFAGVFTADYSRIGPDIDENTVTNNTFNDLFIRVDTQAGADRQVLTASARFDDVDITHTIQDNLIVSGQPGGPRVDSTAPEVSLVVPGEANVEDGTLVPGVTYSYRMTFVDAFGYEAGTSAEFGSGGAMTAGNNAVTLMGLPPASGEFVARNLYRSTNGGAFQLVRQLNGTSVSFTDDGKTKGGQLSIVGSRNRPRLDARLSMDPGLVLKIEGSRVEVQFGAQVIAEGQDGLPITITSVHDDTYGAGGSFDTNGNNSQTSAIRGDWGGFYFSPTSAGSIDLATVQYGGGITELEGNFREYNVIEIHQADVRIANSIIQHNADGFGGPAPLERFDHGRNAAATIFVRGAQPVLLSNTIKNNTSVAINIDANALSYEYVIDPGRSTGQAAIDDAFGNNRGPLVRRNLMEQNGINAMQIRGATLQSLSVWDDTDIVHYLEDTIHIADMFHLGGLRLESSPNESLVVKLNGGGFEATGRPLEIEDRVGGILQVLGAPGFPVVFTSIDDDTVGAGFDPRGFPLNDTDNDGSASPPGPGDWDGILINQFAHDRNVVAITEQELNQDVAPGVNATPQTSQFLGQLGAGEKDTDENLRLGFEINGYLNAPGDYDVYAFTADAGTEVWFDIDRTTQDLDTVVELIDVTGAILAQSDNSEWESADPLSFRVIDSASIPDEDVNILQKSASSLGNGKDFFTTNPRDAGMRVVLPGAEGTTNEYYVRVRSSNIADAPFDTGADRTPLQDPARIDEGLTFGVYQLQVRLQEADEFAGSAIAFADIRYATNGIQILGHPIHSTVAQEGGEDANEAGANDVRGGATDIGNIRNSDRATLGIAGRLRSGADVDFFEFEVSASSIQGAGGSLGYTFDLDYADALARPDTIISVFDAAGNLVYIGRNSNVADDQPGPGETTSIDDLSRGSAGVLDPFIGSVNLSEGKYFAAVSLSSNVPTELRQFTSLDAANKLLRLEPISQVQRIVEDRINGDGIDGIPGSPQQTVLFDPTTAFVPFHLGDVSLFVSQNGGNVQIVDPFSGARETNLGDSGPVLGDIVMRRDGELVAIPQGTNDADSDNVVIIDTGDATTVTAIGDSGIQTFRDDPNAAGLNVQQHNVGIQFEALAIRGTNDVDLFGVGNRVPGNLVDFSTNALYQFNQRTGAAISDNPGARTGNARINGMGTQIREIGQVNAAGEVTGLAFLGNTLYAVDDFGNLYTVSTGNANTTHVGQIRENGVTLLELLNSPDGGTFSISIGPEMTNAIDFDATDNEVETELEMLDVFTSEEIQTITATDIFGDAADGGTFTLSFMGDTTNTLDPTAATATDIENALVADIVAIGAGDIQVTGDLRFGTTIQIEFLDAGAFGNQDVTQLVTMDSTQLNFPTGGVGSGFDFTTTNQQGGQSGVSVTSRTGGTLDQSDFEIEFVGFLSGTTPGTLTANNIDLTPMTVPAADVQITTIATGASITGIAGLTNGPESVSGGAYSNLLFAITTGGDLYAVDTTGLAQPVFVDHATSVNVGIGGVSGLDFGTLERNLWHVTTNRATNSGHGVSNNGNNGNNSIYFGNEVQSESAGNKNGLTNTRVRDYNFPGGAHGTIESEPFSLEGYSAEDRPVLYFNYLIDTADDNGVTPTDILRVSIAGPDGNFDVLATNNSSFGLEEAEQQLFDDAGQWRQARIQLDAYAGLSDLQLRFDFSTGGSIRAGSTDLIGDELRIIAGTEIEDGEFFLIDGHRFEFERGFTLEAPSGHQIDPGDQFTLDNGLGPVVFEFTTGPTTGNVDLVYSTDDTAREIASTIQAALLAEGITFHRNLGGTGTRLNIPTVMTATQTGLPMASPDFLQGQFGESGFADQVINITDSTTQAQVTTLVHQAIADEFAQGDISVIPTFRNVVRVIGHDVDNPGPLGLTDFEAGSDHGDQPEQGQNNAFEGVYLDDFVIGLTERGEFAFGTAADSTYSGNGNPQAIGGGPSIGDYQLEIRRSEEHEILGTSIDTNERNLRGTIVTAGAGIDISDGDRFILGDGLRTLIFEFDEDTVDDGVPAGIVQIPFLSTFSSNQVAEAIRDAINSTAVQNVIDIRAVSSDGPDSGSNSTANSIHLVGNAVSDNFGNTDFVITPSLAVTFTIHNTRGDANIARQQGQIIVRGNQITDSANYGIDVRAGTRNPGIIDNGGQIPHPGSAINFEEPNADELIPGVVIVNNVIANSGTGGIRFGGSADTSQTAPVPFGRIVNNTVFGGGTGTGIRIQDNASPTVVNNILADLAIGIEETGSSTTVLTANYFQDNVDNVIGLPLGTFSIVGGNGDALFVDASNDNYYLDNGARPIDSSLDSIGDRQAMFDFRDPIGISRSPILAPDDDAFGQMRIDDPDQAPPSGLGSNVFKDRGAIERADFDGPTAHLVFNGTVDNTAFSGMPLVRRDALGVETVFGVSTTSIVVEDPLFFNQFVIEVQDDGIGVDDNSLLNLPGQVTIEVTDANGTTTLTEGTDYRYQYNTNTNRITLTALTFFEVDRRYAITLNRGVAGIRDRAGNEVIANQVDGMATAITRFDILLVDNENDAPVNSVPLATQTVAENTTAAPTVVTFSAMDGNAISVDDPDAFINTNQLQIELVGVNGKITLPANHTSLVTIDSGTGANDSSVTFTGTIPSLNTLFAGGMTAAEKLQFIPAPDYNGPAGINITTNDLGNFSAPPIVVMSDMDAISIDVTPVNSSPIVTAPATAVVVEDDPFVFPGTISVSDIVDGNQGVQQVSLSVADGALALGSTAGLDFLYSDTDGAGDANGGDGTLQFRGSIGDINTALIGLTYTPVLNYNNSNASPAAPDILTVMINDLGNTGAGGNLTDSGAVEITVTAENDAPVNQRDGMPVTGTPRINALEHRPTEASIVLDGSSVNAPLLSVVDVDVDEATVNTGILKVTLTATDGTLTLADTSGLTFAPAGSSNDGDADAMLTFSGTQAGINNALNGMQFNLIPGFTTLSTGRFATITITTEDEGRTGPLLGALSDTDMFEIDVLERNDEPVSNIPGPQNIEEDSALPLEFSVLNGNSITITDPDAGALTVQVSLTAANGSLVLNPAEVGDLVGAFADSEGTRDADGSDGTLVFRGSLTDLNEALDGLQYTPTPDFFGAETLLVVTNDLGNTGNGGPMVTSSPIMITVDPRNDSPAIQLGTPMGNTLTVNALEDNDFTISSAAGNQIVIADPVDDPSATGLGDYDVTLSISEASPGGLTLFTTADLDFGQTGGDSDGSDGTLRFRGTLPEVNAALNGLVYSPPMAVSDENRTLTITVDDLGNIDSDLMPALSATGTMTIIIDGENDAPENTVPASGVLTTTEEDTALVFSSGNSNAISVFDIDASTAEVQVTLSAVNGTLTLNGMAGLDDTFGDALGTGDLDGSDGTLEFRGTIGAINTALDGLAFTPGQDYVGAASLTITTNDLGNTGAGGPMSDSDTVSITVGAVNDAPVIDGPAGLTVDEDSSITISAANMNGISIDDVDLGAGKFAVTINLDHGTLTLRRTTGLNFSAGADGTSSMSFTGSRTAVNSALDASIYTPDPGYTGSDTLSVVASDQGSSGSGGPQMDAVDIPITVRGINDAPVLTLGDTDVSLDEDGSLSFSTSNMNQIFVSDVDVLEGDGRVEVTLSAGNGTLTLSTQNNISISSGMDGTGSLTFDGPIGDVNVALSGLLYQPVADFNGNDTIDVHVSDLMNFGFMATELTDDGSIAVTVNAVNDDPINAVPGPQSTLEDNDLTFSPTNTTPNGITISDVDAGTAVVEVSLSVSSGALTLGNPGLVDFSQPGGDSDGSDGSLQFQGTIASINSALDGLTYSPTTDFFGTSTLSITTSDLGNTGSGGAGTDLDTVSISVTAQNDRPVAVANSYTLQQGATLTANDLVGLDGEPNNDSVLLNDSDPDGDPLNATIEATSGPAFHSGLFTLNPNGTFTYQHDGSANYSDSFSYRANDGSLDSDPVVVSILINAAPSVTGGSFTVDENSLNGTVVGTVAASDANMDSLQYSITGGNTDSAFSISSSGQISVANSTALDFESTPSFALIVEVTDGNGGTSNASVNVALNDLSEAIVISPTDFTDDGVSIVRSGSRVRVVNTLSGMDLTAAHELDKISSLTLTGRDAADDTLTVDYAGGNPIPTSGIVYDGGTAGNDSLNVLGGSVTNVAHLFTDASSGSVNIDGSLISYTNLEPISDLLVAQTRSFTFGAASDAVTLSDSGTANDGRSMISSVATSESVEFNVPTDSIEVILGSGNDQLTAGSLDGNFTGTVIVRGETGNDIINAAGLHADIEVYGGSGNDNITGGNGNDLFFGDAGNDVLSGGPGNDRMFAGSGGDTLTGGTGNNELHGQGTNLDVIRETVSGTVVLTDSTSLTAFLSWDTGSSLIRKSEFIELTGTASAENINLSGFDLHLRGVTVQSGDGPDVVVGSPKGDLIETGGGNDSVHGGAGNDIIDLGDGDDFAQGEDGEDLIFGGAGDDNLGGGNQIDYIDPGETDSLDIVNGGGSGGDRLVVNLASSAPLDITFIGKILPKTPTERILINRVERIDIIGTPGNDRFDFSDYFGAVTLNAGDGDDTFIGTEQGDVIRGEGGNDVIDGNGGGDYVLAGTGDDAVRGGAGNDIIVGDRGDDTMLGGSGNDFLLGSGGRDVILGEEGDDVIRGQGSADSVSGGGNGVPTSPGDILLTDAVDQVFEEDLLFDFDALL